MATRNFRPPFDPSRTSTDAVSEPTSCAAMRRRFSIEFVSGAVREFATSTRLMASRRRASNETLPSERAPFFATRFLLDFLGADFIFLVPEEKFKTTEIK